MWKFILFYLVFVERRTTPAILFYRQAPTSSTHRTGQPPAHPSILSWPPWGVDVHGMMVGSSKSSLSASSAIELQLSYLSSSYIHSFFFLTNTHWLSRYAVKDQNQIKEKGGGVLKYFKLKVDLKESIIIKEYSFVCTVIQCVNIKTVI